MQLHTLKTVIAVKDSHHRTHYFFKHALREKHTLHHFILSERTARHLPGNTLVHVKTLWVSTFPDSLPRPTPDSNLKPSLETKSSILKVCHMMFSLPGSKTQTTPNRQTPSLTSCWDLKGDVNGSFFPKIAVMGKKTRKWSNQTLVITVPSEHSHWQLYEVATWTGFQ